MVEMTTNVRRVVVSLLLIAASMAIPGFYWTPGPPDLPHSLLHLLRGLAGVAVIPLFGAGVGNLFGRPLLGALVAFALPVIITLLVMQLAH